MRRSKGNECKGNEVIFLFGWNYDWYKCGKGEGSKVIVLVICFSKNIRDLGSEERINIVYVNKIEYWF